MRKGSIFGGAGAGVKAALRQRPNALASNTLSWTDQICALGNGFVGTERSVNLQSGVEGRQFFRMTATGQLLSILPSGQVSENQVDRLSRLPAQAMPSFADLPLAAIVDPEVHENFLFLVEELPGALHNGLAAIAVAEGQFWVLDSDVLQLDGSEQRLLHLSLIDADARWVPVPMAALGLDRIRSITAVAAFAPWLYVAVCDPVAGFALYRCDLGDTSGGFEPVITRGAQRFALNGAVSAMALGPEGLLIGTAAMANGKHPVGSWGPELLLLDADGTWDLILGQPRFSADQLRFPRSATGPGFGRPANAAIKAIAQSGLDERNLICVVVQEYSGKPIPDRAKTQFDHHDYAGAVAIYTSQDWDNWTRQEAKLPDDSGSVTCVALSQAGILIGHETIGESDRPATFVRF